MAVSNIKDANYLSSFKTVFPTLTDDSRVEFLLIGTSNKTKLKIMLEASSEKTGTFAIFGKKSGVASLRTTQPVAYNTFSNLSSSAFTATFTAEGTNRGYVLDVDTWSQFFLITALRYSDYKDGVRFTVTYL